MKTIDSVLENVDIIEKGKLESQYLVLQLMKLRNNKGITQNQLAKEIGVSHTTIARIENFTMQPTLKMILQILDVYGMTLNIFPQNQRNDTFLENTDETNNAIVEGSPSERHDLARVIGEFYNHSSLNFGSTDNYITFMNDYLLLYVDILKKYRVNTHITNKVMRFNRYISIVLNEYYSGRHNMAYSLFKEALNACIDVDIFTRNISNSSVFYRARKHKINENLDKQDMFHIPFEKRFKVATERYSYPGLPCLYLGSSPEVCATELGKTPEELTIARFIYHKRKDECKVFDLTSLLFDYFTGVYENDSEKFLANLPLILVCSTYSEYVDKSEVKFKKEYILPQLLLEYIINESVFKDYNVIGIKYFSVKEDFIQYFLNGDFYNMQKICNFVFPAQETKNNEGYCSQLKDMFEVAEICKQYENQCQ